MKIEQYVESALLEMLKTKPIKHIFVSNIIEEVGICKGTFYKYYCDKYDLLQKCFDNAYYRDIKEHSDTFEQFVENSINVFRKTPKVVLHAMLSEDSNSIFEYNSRLIYDYIVKDRIEEGKETNGEHHKYLILFYARSITQLIMEWLRAPRAKQTDEMMSLIRDIMPCAL